MTTTTQQALRIALEAAITRVHEAIEHKANFILNLEDDAEAYLSTNEDVDYYRKLRSALAASAEPAPAQVVAIPEGWQIVPKTITEEMHVAAVKMAQRCTGNDDFPRRVYQAMLSAAPSLPQPSEQSADLWMCDQSTGREGYIKSGPLSEMIKERDRLNALGNDYFIKNLPVEQSAAPAPEAQQEPNPWLDGAPSHPWDKEWFIAETTYGDRVVLTALPEEYAYDFKTADETYWRRDKIKKWMQFPDSEFVAPAAPSAAPEGWQEQIAHLKYRKRELETEVSDLRNTLAALKAAPVAQDGQSELKYWREQNKNLMHLRSAVDGKTHAERIATLSAQPVAKQSTEQISDEEIIEAWEDEVANTDELDVADAQIIAFARALLSHQAQPVADKDAQEGGA